MYNMYVPVIWVAKMHVFSQNCQNGKKETILQHCNVYARLFGEFGEHQGKYSIRLAKAIRCSEFHTNCPERTIFDKTARLFT